MRADLQVSLRTAYAGRRRKGFFSRTSRVAWKSKSRLVA